MLILKRRSAEEVVLDEDSRVTLVSTTADSVTLKVTLPQGVSIKRIDVGASLDCESVLVPSVDTVTP